MQSSSGTGRRFRVAVDIGGTFTDCVVVAEDGERMISKALTTHGALSDGVMEALGANAEQFGLSRAELLAATDTFVHGTTVATNALLTRRGVRIGLITTRGHEDNIIIGKVYSKRAGLTEREIVRSSRLAKPEPFIDPEHIVGVTERIDAAGEELVALNEADVVDAMQKLVAAGVEAIAVSTLWSFVNDSHERRIREIIAHEAPGLFVALSSEVSPALGEYERTVTTALTAYVGPIVSAYLRGLESRLRDEGMRRPLLVMQANGGLTSVSDASNRPIVTLDSGPTGGILGSQYLGELYGEQNVICTDVGGTSFEVGLVLRGRVPLDEDPVVSQFNLRVPKLTVRSIGAGGGSIAWIDAGGLMRVGPQSAGSRPGPACYGLGGTLPTVTDADLVLGYLDENAFLGGRMALRRDLAMKALAELGKSLGLEPEEAAAGIFRIINAQMADLIRKTTIEQGHDPRECILVSYGGAGPTHAAFYGKEIGAKTIMIPARSTAFSAEGMLTCDLVHSLQGARFLTTPFADEDLAALAEDLERLERAVVEQYESEQFDPSEVEIVRELGVRYHRQAHTVPVPIGSRVDAGAMQELKGRFEQRYAELYGDESLLPTAGIELDTQRVTGRHALSKPPLTALERTGSDGSHALTGHRPIYWEGSGYVETPLYDGNKLLAGDRFTGPAVIQRMGDSVVVPRGTDAVVDEYMSIRLAPVQAGGTEK